MSSAAEIAKRLTEAQRKALRPGLALAAGHWFHAAWFGGKRPGNVYSVLADKGFFERRSDPDVWGRSQYRITPLGLAVRAELKRLESHD
ncbi:MAG: hypothetical protein QOH47_2371 [Sphingomonadales bacterium]|jgi:hypothetical protein|nr:hypothetical protein [Sphingomonadales bacterium]